VVAPRPDPSHLMPSPEAFNYELARCLGARVTSITGQQAGCGRYHASKSNLNRAGVLQRRVAIALLAIRLAPQGRRGLARMAHVTRGGGQYRQGLMPSRVDFSHQPLPRRRVAQWQATVMRRLETAATDVRRAVAAQQRGGDEIAPVEREITPRLCQRGASASHAVLKIPRRCGRVPYAPSMSRVWSGRRADTGAPPATTPRSHAIGPAAWRKIS
jgi:hypothetical protein